jgi:Na+/H+ antiporter NhaC
MDNIISWIIAFVLIFTAFWSIGYEYQKRQNRSAEEYQKDIEKQGITGNRLLQVGLLELEKFLKPNLSAAEEHLQDEKQGQTKTKKQGDDKDQTTIDLS